MPAASTASEAASIAFLILPHVKRGCDSVAAIDTTLLCCAPMVMSFGGTEMAEPRGIATGLPKPGVCAGMTGEKLPSEPFDTV